MLGYRDYAVAGSAMKRFSLACAAVLGLVTLTPLPAMADLFFVGPTVVGGGFGLLPRALTFDSHSSSLTESGCIAPDGSGGLASGSGACATGAVSSDGGVDTATGGNESPPIGHPKNGVFTAAALGISGAGSLGIIYDAIQPSSGNNPSVTFDDLTLKLYAANFQPGDQPLITADLVPTPLTEATSPGNGHTDFIFKLNDAEAALFNAVLASNAGAVFALDSTLTFPDVAGGSESFTLLNLPEPGTLGLLAMSLLGFVMLRRARKKA